MICPLCASEHTRFLFPIKDHSISKESFELRTCLDCQHQFTFPFPSLEDLPRYYQSDVYISHTDSQEGWFNRAYQIIRRFALGQKRQLIQEFTGKMMGNLLDYGCGTGAFLNAMQRRQWKVQGMEPDAGAREKAEKLLDQPLLSPEDWAKLHGQSFDAITLWHVLEHVPDPNALIPKLKSVLSSSGVLVLALPNRDAWDAQHYGTYWAAYDVPRHLHHFNPQIIKNLMASHGFELVGTRPMWFDAFYVSLLSEAYRKGYKNVISAFVMGLYSNLKAWIKPGTCSSQIYLFKIRN